VGMRTGFCVGLLCSSCLTILINLEVCVCGSNYYVPGERLELVSSVHVRTRALYHCMSGGTDLSLDVPVFCAVFV
jgi:hypothetical protein